MDKKYIPLDKSWIIRMGILDMINGYDDIQKFLSEQQSLGEDLLALKRTAINWNSNKPIDVGESGTLYRLLKFISWKIDLDKRFITRGTLASRKITDDPSIVHFSQRELLALDNGTSQWATAAVLLGDKERLPDPPFKLQLTYEAVDHWKKKRRGGDAWVSRYDATISHQAQTYLELLKGRKIAFVSEQAEDFCFAYTFGYITAEEGEKRWPALHGHESDRIVEMKEALEVAKSGREIISKDHRVVQAIAMWGKINNKNVNITHPSVVNKSWPQFWDFLNFQT
jgi:hypothetical protein